MKLIVLVLLGIAMFVGAAWFIVLRIRSIRKDRKKRKLELEAEKQRRKEILAGAVSESAFKRHIAFQAAVSHAAAYFAEALAGIVVSMMCFCLSAIFYLVTPRAMEPMSLILVIEPLVIGLFFLGVEMSNLIDFKFFHRDLSGEYRALLDLEETSAEELE